MVLVPTATNLQSRLQVDLQAKTLIKNRIEKQTAKSTTTRKVRMTQRRSREIIEDFFMSESGIAAVSTTSQAVFDYAFAEAVRRMCIYNSLTQKRKKKPSASNYEPVFYIELGKNEDSAIIYDDKKQLAINLKVNKLKSKSEEVS